MRETAERRLPQAQPTPQRAIQHPQLQPQHSPPLRANLQTHPLQAPAQEHSKLMAAPLVAQITRLEPRKMDNSWSGVEAPAGVMRAAQQYHHHPLQPQYLPPPPPQQRTPLPRTYLAQDQYRYKCRASNSKFEPQIRNSSLKFEIRISSVILGSNLKCPQVPESIPECCRDGHEFTLCSNSHLSHSHLFTFKFHTCSN